jgi:ankyrin repeat protein
MSIPQQGKQLKNLVRQGDLPRVQALLDTVTEWSHADLAEALTRAAKDKHLDIVTVLLDAGANPNGINGSPTPLHAALDQDYDQEAHLALVQTLLKAGANVDPPQPSGRYVREWHKLTPFQMAIKHRARETALLLLEHGADLNRRNSKQATALMLATEQAIYDHDRNMFEWLLELGADPNTAKYDFQRTPLTIAAFWNCVDLMDCLVQAGADVNKNYALLTAAERGNIEAARRLLELGADPNQTKETHISDDCIPQQIPLIKAIDSPALLQLLLDYGAQVDVTVQLYDGAMTPLEYARAQRLPHHEEATTLLAAALAVQNPDKARQETAHYLDGELVNTARDPRQGKPLDYWLDQGADPNGRNEYGRTALHYVAEHGRSPADARLLLQAGADIDARDPFGYTPLHDSVLGDNGEIIELLLDFGADPAARVKRGIHHGHTALEIARIERRKNAIRLLATLSPEPRPLTPCEPELRKNGSVKGFSHIYYEQDAAQNVLAKEGKRGHHIYMHQAGKRPYWTAKGTPQKHTEPCVRTIDHDIRSEYRGTGIPRAEHPLRWRMAMDACLHCGSEDVLVIHAGWGVQPHSGDAAWSYEIKCTVCGYYSSWGYDDS